MKYIYYFFILFAIACNKSIPEIKTFDLSKIKDAVVDTNIIAEYRYVKLETNDDCLIGHIDKIVLHKDLIYILDRKHAKSIFIFDTLGNYKNKIYKQGKGPGEYSYLNDFIVDSQGFLHVSDASTKKTLIYSTDGLEFQGSINNPCSFKNFGLIDSTNTYIYFRGSKFFGQKKLKHNIIISNDSVKSLNYFFKYRKGIDEEYFGLRNLLFCSDAILFSPLLDNTIYEIRNDNVIPKYYFDFGKSNLPKSYARNGFKAGKPIEVVLQNEKFGHHLEKYFENSKYLVAEFWIRNRPYRFFYSKKSGKYFVKKIIPFDQTDEGFLIWADYGPYAMNKNTFVGIIDQSQINLYKTIVDNDQNFAQKHYLNYELLKTYNDFDNPILLLYTLKDF